MIHVPFSTAVLTFDIWNLFDYDKFILSNFEIPFQAQYVYLVLVSYEKDL